MIMIPVGLVLGALPHGTDFLMSLVQAPPQPPPVAAEAGGIVNGINLAHLWFLYYLLIFYALALAIRWLVLAVDPRGVLAAVCDRVVAFVMRGVWGPVLIALPVAVYLWQLQSWTEWLGLPAPFSLVPNTMALIGYGMAFGLGWLLNRQTQALLDLAEAVAGVPGARRRPHDLLPVDHRHDAALARADARRHGPHSVHGCVCRRPLVLGVCVRRRRGAVLVEREPRDALSRRCVVLDLPDALVDGALLHHAAATRTTGIGASSSRSSSAARCRFCS